MDFRFGGELPDDHVYLNRVRPIVDWSFKFISWIAITATLGVAADVTSNKWLWGMYAICQLLLFWFLQTFFSWLFTMKFPRKAAAKPRAEVARTGIKLWVYKARTILIAVLAFFVWTCFQVAMQQAIARAVTAVEDFQKSGRGGGK